ncbi:hypothetical protein TMO_a0217 (plasmid) [Tistrella mobilis KA081020-065]|uniref:Uncharacterized protein n=1 Tax=Tistrella mobilis (strain KA081020-065) TaxID=1110502 RepID=I3TS82_TISMK|nr:hypothetical protein TMO_a0217 [Tistrella mobilis KA081020-065]
MHHQASSGIDGPSAGSTPAGRPGSPSCRPCHGSGGPVQAGRVAAASSCREPSRRSGVVRDDLTALFQGAFPHGDPY